MPSICFFVSVRVIMDGGGSSGWVLQVVKGLVILCIMKVPIDMFLPVTGIHFPGGSSV